MTEPDLQALLSEGREAMRDEQWDLALERFEAVLALKPDHLESHVASGRAHSRVGNHRWSLNAFEAALVVAPAHAGALIGAARASIELDNPSAGARYAQAAVSLEPEHPGALRSAALAFRGLREHRRAAEMLMRLHRQEPDRGHFHAGIELLLESGLASEARVMFEKEIEAAGVLFPQAALIRAGGVPLLTPEQLRSLAAGHPEAPEPHLALGRHASARSQWTAATSHYLAALTLGLADGQFLSEGARAAHNAFWQDARFKMNSAAAIAADGTAPWRALRALEAAASEDWPQDVLDRSIETHFHLAPSRFLEEAVLHSMGTYTIIPIARWMIANWGVVAAVENFGVVSSSLLRTCVLDAVHDVTGWREELDRDMAQHAIDNWETVPLLDLGAGAALSRLRGDTDQCSGLVGHLLHRGCSEDLAETMRIVGALTPVDRQSSVTIRSFLKNLLEDSPLLPQQIGEHTKAVLFEVLVSVGLVAEALPLARTIRTRDWPDPAVWVQWVEGIVNPTPKSRHALRWPLDQPPWPSGPVISTKRAPQRALQRGAIPVFSKLRDEMSRLPDFYDHYRQLGATHFFLVDNGSVDGSLDWILDQDDTFVWTCDSMMASVKDFNPWLNTMIDNYCAASWCVYVDVDEHLDFRHCDEGRTIADLIKALEQEGADHLSSFMLDMFPAFMSDLRPCPAGVPLAEFHPWFEPPEHFSGTTFPPYSDPVGGFRDRVLPDLNSWMMKLPLMNAALGHRYLTSSHCIEGGRPGREGSVLRHYKFAADLEIRSQLGDLNARVLPRAAVHNPEAPLTGPNSVRYTGSLDFDAAGLFEAGWVSAYEWPGSAH